MMSNITPGVILTQRFKQAWQVSADYYADALEYTDREEATLQPDGFEEYQEYMDNEEKTEKETGLFTAFDEHLTQKQKSWYKTKFRSAHENDGLLWQPIISFTDEWLKEQGVICKESGLINEVAIKEATRNAMKTMLIKENLMGRVYWAGAIHYNTDNVHVHISMVEKKVERTRGSIKQSTIDAAKSKVVSTLTDRTKEQILINKVMRDEILKNARQTSYENAFKTEFLNIVKNIQKTQYGRLSDIEKQQVDKLSHLILKKQFPWTYEFLQKKLDQESHYYKRAYGIGNRHLYEQYKANKESELLSKLGNSILKQATRYKSDEKKQLFEKKKLAFQKKRAAQLRRYQRRQSAFERNAQRFELKKATTRLNQMRRKTEQNFKRDLYEYERMVKESSYER